MSKPRKPVQYIESPSTWDDAPGEVFVCFAWPSSSKAPAPASYHELEEESSFAKQPFAGGLQACVIVRYLDSPVGAYDELLWIPGAFNIPGSGQKTYRATRAYVSTKNSVYNGRKNWNVPKACAKFEFTDSKTKHFPYSRVTISKVDGTEPFLELELKPMSLASRPFLPINTKYFPISLDFDFPPLPKSQDRANAELIGTQEWQHLHLEISGKAGLVRAAGKVGDGKLYPNMGEMKFWIWLKDAKISIKGVSKGN